jgi:putative acetyltransferase
MATSVRLQSTELFGRHAQPPRMFIDNVPVVIGPGDPLGAEALELLRQMRAEAVRRYADVIADSAPPTNEPLVPRSAFLLARLGVQPVGCAALRPLLDEVAEVKRMYVSKSVRRRGIGRLLLATLAETASILRYRTVRLETGIRQPEAIALYESQGFCRIPAYGDHAMDPLSICFERKLPHFG